MIFKICREILSSRFKHFSRQFFWTEKSTPIFSLLECMFRTLSQIPNMSLKSKAQLVFSIYNATICARGLSFQCSSCILCFFQPFCISAQCSQPHVLKASTYLFCAAVFCLLEDTAQWRKITKCEVLSSVCSRSPYTLIKCK